MPLSVLTVVDLFRGTSDADAQRIARLCSERRFPAGATIFQKGDAGDSLYIVKEGLVRLLSLSEKGAETTLHLFKPGNVFGELILSEDRRAFSAVAATDVLVTVVSRKGFVDILGAVPHVAENFIRLLSRRLTKVEREFAEFGHTWSYHRLALVLLSLAREHGVETPKGTKIAVRLTHDDLAKLIGTTRETVTTQINRLSRKGLVRREGRVIVINAPRLRKFVGQDERPPADEDAG